MIGGTSDGEARPRALLFSGHMIDAPDRSSPRFPAALEPEVARALEDELARLGAGPTDVAISSGACGGDLLFAEALLGRGVPLRIYLPFEEPKFLEKSVRFAGARWEARFRDVVARSQLFLAPDVLGPLPEGADPYERTNLWMLDEARRIGGPKVVFLCLWNGEGGDGPGGTQHMMEAVRRPPGGDVVWIDIRRFY